MPSDENWAVKADGTLKDASEMEWAHSPSDEKQAALPFDDGWDASASPTPSGNDHPDTTATEPPSPVASEFNTPAATAASGLSNKLPARIVGSKRVVRPSSKVRGSGSLQNMFAGITGEFRLSYRCRRQR